MKRLCLLLVGLVIAAPSCRASSPSDGMVKDGGYENSYFHFRYVPPKGLNPRPTQTLLLNQNSASRKTEFLLFSAQQGSAPYGVVLFAEKLNSPPNSVKDAKDFILRARNTAAKNGNYKELKQLQMGSVAGFEIHELDYQLGAEYDAAMVVEAGEFVLVFKCNAANADDLKSMTNSVIGMKKLP